MSAVLPIAQASEGPYLTDEEVDSICAGLKQNAAKVKFLRGLGYMVERKPNGRPLARRPSIHGGRPSNGPKWSRPA